MDVFTELLHFFSKLVWAWHAALLVLNSAKVLMVYNSFDNLKNTKAEKSWVFWNVGQKEGTGKYTWKLVRLAGPQGIVFLQCMMYFMS